MSPPNAVRAEVVICNQKGLHARASAKFVRCAGSFDAEVTVTRDDQTVGGESIMGLMMLAAGPGTTIVIEAKGKEAEAALAAGMAEKSKEFAEVGAEVYVKS